MKKASQHDDVRALVTHLNLGGGSYREFEQPTFGSPSSEPPRKSQTGPRKTVGASVTVPVLRSSPEAAAEAAPRAGAASPASAPLAFTFERLRRVSAAPASRLGKLDLGLAGRTPVQGGTPPAQRDRLLVELFASIERRAHQNAA